MYDILLDVGDENACNMDMINVSSNKRVQRREMSTADHTLPALQRVVYSGWLDTIKDLPKDLRPYWSYRDEIGIFFQGKHVIISDVMRSDIMHQLQCYFTKLTSELREQDYTHARVWPNAYKDIEIMVKCCATCQESQTTPRQQPLLAHDVPSTPWTRDKVASIMFQIKQRGAIICSLPVITPKFYLVKKIH